MVMDAGTDTDSTTNPKRPAGRIVGRALGLVAIGAVLGGGAVWMALRQDGGPPAAARPAAKKPLYQCPMHPTITADHPSDCPICGMKLVEVKEAPAAAGGASAPAERKLRFYRSPMDPKQTSPTPRKDEMGMDYVPVYEDEAQGGGAGAVAGLAAVSIDPARQQLIGLRTAAVSRGSVAGSWRTVGRVQINPRGVRKTNIKVEGYIERLYVDFVGQPVRKGEPLFSIYSPSLLAAENEYLLALATRDALAKGGAPGDNGDTLVSSARRKLELWDVPASEIERLLQTRAAAKALVFVSPIAGVVTVKNVVEGARVNPGDTPFEITDLSTVWVMADAYETDLGQVHVGMPAALTLQAYPNQRFTGKAEFIDPLLDPKTRTAKVRLHFSNPTGALKPGMFGEVVLEGTAREGLRIPADAVVRSGTTDVVFLALGNGKFEPRVVQLGAKSADEVEVQSGLAEGQEVVMRANFLVDSESQLRSSLSAIGGL